MDNVYVAEIFFNPQIHTMNKVAFETVISGLARALADGHKDFGINGSLIMCFLQYQSEEDALKALEESRPHAKNIVGIELNCGEMGNFSRVYKEAKELGLRVIAYSCKECTVDQTQNFLDIFQVSRFNLAVQCPNDSAVVQRLSAKGIPLALCPLANEKNLHAAYGSSNGKNPIKDLLNKGLRVTINSDHPAYFGGYTTGNFLAAVAKEGLTEVDVHNMCKSAFDASFIPQGDKEHYFNEIDYFTVCMGYKAPARSVTIFGSRAALPGSADYDVAYNAGKLFASRGFRVVTGGYSGVMEAAAKGALDGACGISPCITSEGDPIGGCAHGILAPRIFATRGSTGNSYNTHTQIAHTLVDRLCRLITASEYFLALGGTIGTITEALLVWNVASVRPINGTRPPKIFLWRAAWEVPFKELGKCISAADMELVQFVDTLEEVLEEVEADIKDRRSYATL